MLLHQDLIQPLNKFLDPYDIDQLHHTHTTFTSLVATPPKISIVTHLNSGAHETYIYQVAPKVYKQNMICHGLCNMDGTIEMRSNYITYGEFIMDRYLYSHVDLSHQTYYQINIYDDSKQLILSQDVNDYLFLNIHKNKYGLVDSILIHYLDEDFIDVEEDDYDW
jgi:hypothetical protein